MSYQDRSGGGGVGGITGMLTVVRGDRRATHELTPKLIADWMPFRSFKQFPRFESQSLRYESVLPEAKPDTNLRNTARQREHSEWLLWAEASEQVKFSVRILPVGKGDPKPVPVSLYSPSGKLTHMAGARGDGETAYEFKASETGAHKIVCEPRSWTATLNSSSSRVCLFAPGEAFHFISTTGQFHFWVPSGTKEFGVKISGGGGTESVKAALHDSSGSKVEEMDNIAQAQQFVITRKESARGEIWSLRFDKPSTGVLEDFYVQLQGVPPVLSPTREGLLKPAN